MQILNTILQSLLDQIAHAYGNLLPIANYFFLAFGALALVKLGLAYAYSNNIGLIENILMIIFRMAFMAWVINNLPHLHQVLRDSALKLGLVATGNTIALDLVLNPSEIASYGFKAIAPIQTWLGELSWSLGSAGPTMISMVCGLVAMLLIIAAFFYLALQMFMTLVDFYFTSVLAPIFLALQVFRPTAWIGSGAIRGPIQHAVKLFTMSFIISLTIPWLGALTNGAELSTLADAWSIVIASLILIMLALRAGTWASGLFAGGPSASAGDMATTAGIAAGAGVVGNYAGRAAMHKVGGVAMTTGAAAVSGAKTAGSNYAGNSSAVRMAMQGMGALKGTTRLVTGTPKAVQERIAKAFKEQISHGTQSGMAANSKSSSAQSAIQKAKMYERIAKNFKEQNRKNGDD